MPSVINVRCDLPSRQVEVLGSRMHCLDTGPAGDGTVLFLHGNPTSSYLWRNVIPHVAPLARCVAPDLIGFGESDKPEIAYSYADHIRYIDAFIDTLDTRELTLVLHDWGTAIGLHWARRHEARVRGVALMEFLSPVPSWNDWPEGIRPLFQAFRTPGAGEQLILEQNAFIEKVLPGAVARGLSEAEMVQYRAPFPAPASRRPMLAFPRQLPIENQPADVTATAAAYMQWLETSSKPKLLFWGEPGILVTSEQVRRYEQSWPNLRTVGIGPGLHYLQEDNPALIGSELARWVTQLA